MLVRRGFVTLGTLGHPPGEVAEKLGWALRTIKEDLAGCKNGISAENAPALLRFKDLESFKNGENAENEKLDPLRFAQRLGMERETVGKHLVKNSELKKLPNELFTKGFLPNTIAEKLDCESFSQKTCCST